MREADWLAGGDPDEMLDFLGGRGSDRKWRLFTCACLREVAHLLVDRRARASFLVLERFAEGEADAADLAAAHADAVAAHRHLFSPSFPHDSRDWRVFDRVQGVHQALGRATLPGVAEAHSQATGVASLLRNADLHDPAWGQRIRATQCALLRDLFGNPFRPVRLRAAWLRSAARQAVAVAAAIHAERSFDEMDVLADALLDADCPCEGLVRHCRECTFHGRGCWVVDLLLKKG
jgi:hypothetical protein